MSANSITEARTLLRWLFIHLAVVRRVELLTLRGDYRLSKPGPPTAGHTTLAEAERIERSCL